MKNTVVLCLFVILSTVNATILNSLLNKVKNAKLSVDKSTGDVNNLRNNVRQETDFTIMDKWSKEIEKLNNNIERTLKRIEKEIDKTKDNNAQCCYNAAFNFIRSVDYATYTHAQLCHEYAKNSIRNNLDFIDNLVSTGRGLWLSLDDIFSNCYDSASGISNILKLRTCIIDQLKIYNNDVNALIRNVKSAKYTAKAEFNSVTEESNKCLNNIYSMSQSHITEAEEIFSTCLKARCCSQKEHLLLQTE